MINKQTIFKNISLLILLLAYAICAETNSDNYEPGDDICGKCNCSNINGTEYNGQAGTLFTLDCSFKDFRHIFPKWPETIGDNHTGVEIMFIMSFNSLGNLQQLPQTDAMILFTCRHCKITEISSGAFIDTPNIMSLDLSWNNIASEKLNPDIFRGPYSDHEYEQIMLETLELSHNNINYLDKLLFEHTPNIKSLDLSFNPINTFDEPTEAALASLHKLEILNLSHTGLLELPGIIFESMKQLSELFLYGNQFLAVPESLIAVGETLQYLHLSENPIELMDKDSFAGLVKLEQLNISGLPNLTEIKKGVFKDLKSLELLHCRGNKQLKDFDMEDLTALEHLKELDVSGNALKILEFGNKSSEVVNVTSKNEIKPKYQKYFKKLRVLKLAKNPWHCDCSMMRALSIFDHKASYFIKSTNDDEARCKTPYDLNAKILYDLPIDYVCDTHASQKTPKIPIYEPPQFLRPKSIMLTVFSVVGVIILGIIIGFAIVCIKRRLKTNDVGYAASPIRYTTVRNSTISNVANTGP